MLYQRSIHWFRRDLRLADNVSLFKACQTSNQVLCVFVFDTLILQKLKNKQDKRVYFLYESLKELRRELESLGSSLLVLYGNPVEEIPKLCFQNKVEALFTNKDYESYAKERDGKVEKTLKEMNISFFSYKDHVIFEEKEILNGSGRPYEVFTPYKQTWLKSLRSQHLEEKKPQLDKLMPKAEISFSLVPLSAMGFQSSSCLFEPVRIAALEKLNNFSVPSYAQKRNHIVDQEGTSRLSIYLRFGLLSIREVFRYSQNFSCEGAEIWRSELIWREFYQMILSQFPHVEKSPFKKQYNNILWQGTEEHFQLWCEGRTGYPLIDAAMRYFSQTGWMHNRLRMVVASFLTKDLLVDYRKGEEYFAQNLLDYDLAANNGGWQWSASTGCDAQPYFRIFNPKTQSQKFDPEGVFIKTHCPELKALPTKLIHAPYESQLKVQNYPLPIVSHEVQRIKCLNMYKKESVV